MLLYDEPQDNHRNCDLLHRSGPVRTSDGRPPGRSALASGAARSSSTQCDADWVMMTSKDDEVTEMSSASPARTWTVVCPAASGFGLLKYLAPPAVGQEISGFKTPHPSPARRRRFETPDRSGMAATHTSRHRPAPRPAGANPAPTGRHRALGRGLGHRRLVLGGAPVWHHGDSRSTTLA
jgi:hypothetical protein